MRVVICFEYLAKLVHQKICVLKTIKPVTYKFRRMIWGQRRSCCASRGCVSFVNKMEQFIQRAQSIENTPSDQSSECAVKRCVPAPPPSQGKGPGNEVGWLHYSGYHKKLIQLLFYMLFYGKYTKAKNIRTKAPSGRITRNHSSELFSQRCVTHAHCALYNSQI